MTYNDKERRTINRLVQAIEDAQGSDFSSDGLFEDRQTAGNNAGLAHETLSGEPIGGHDTSSS